MATIIAGGGRRSAAPTYTPFSPMRSNAGTMDPELMLRELLRSTPPPAAANITAPGNIAESFSRGTRTESGQGGNTSNMSNSNNSNNSNTSNSNNTGSGTLSGAGRAFQGIGFGLSALGQVAQDGGLAQAGGFIGTAGSVMAARTPGQLAMALGPVAAARIGAPAGLFGAIAGLATGDVSRTINSLTALNPALGLANAISGMLGIGTIGGAVDSFMTNRTIRNDEARAVAEEGRSAAANPGRTSIGNVNRGTFGGGVGFGGTGAAAVGRPGGSGGPGNPSANTGGGFGPGTSSNNRGGGAGSGGGGY